MGGLKYGSRPWFGMDIFWNHPTIIIIITNISIVPYPEGLRRSQLKLILSGK